MSDKIYRLVENHYIKFMDLENCHFTWAEIDKLVDDFNRDARERSYDKRYKGERWDAHDDIEGLRMTLKACDKIANQTKGYNPGSVAQGVLASTLGLNARLQLIGRFIALLRRKCLKRDHTVRGNTTSGQSMEQFILECNEDMSHFPLVAEFANLDLGKADSGRTPGACYMQFCYITRLGITPDVARAVIYSVENVKASAPGLSYTLRNELPSGVVLTKEANEITQEVLGNFILDGEGPIAWQGGGDDFNKAQAGMRLRLDRLAWVLTWVNYNFEINFNQTSDFCGMIYKAGRYGLNLVMKMLKVASVDIPNEKYFLEYQLSIRQYLDLLCKIGIENCETMTREIYATWVNEMGKDEVHACTEFLAAFACCTYEQYKAHQVTRKYDIPFPNEVEVALESEDISYKCNDLL